MWFNPSKTPLNHPPSPPKLPIIGNLHQIGLNPHRTLQSLAQKHGPLMLLHLGNVPLLVVSSAYAAREIMKTHDPIFSNRPKASVASGIYECKDIAFSPYGEYWRQVKSICVHKLLSNRKVQSFRNVREEEIALMVEKIKGLVFANARINLGEIFASLTNDVICRVALGRKYNDGEGGRKFKEVLETLGELLGAFDVGEFIPWLVWMKYINGMDSKVKKVAKDLDEFLESVVQMHIDEKRIKGNNGEKMQDFVDVLLEIQKKNETGFVLDGISVKALILVYKRRRTDTTFTLLEWTMSELLRHKHIMKKLKNEVRNIAGVKSHITEDDLDKLQYLKAVIKETLRLHPPLPLLVPRESTQDVKLLGYDIAAGTRVIVNVWAIGRDPSLWEDPDKFWPDRFLNSPIDFKGQHFELIPFGGGRRSCPGAAFAMGIVELALANLVVNFEFLLPGGVDGEDLDMTEGDGITVHKKFPLTVLASFNSL
ncbi:cytochrome P450 71A26-like [Olea europaea subsp. europaea]|uniref:Cytochrome P450 71A26-like n=1 Tax=Olea europaea subsp. europaea TaxID=158383 RepID=A0A8S0UIH7_OLEEU|nr:cytochrome P450 71A26-like [Olea europaea subsp. europaea]